MNINMKLCAMPIFVSLLFANCAGDSGTEKHQHSRSKVVDVKNKVKGIVIDDVLIGDWSSLYLLDKYLIVEDPRSWDEQIHLFDKNTFLYLRSTAPLGQGPHEITNIGHVGVNEMSKEFYVADNSKYKIFRYSIDSLLSNEHYIPTIKTNLRTDQIPSWYKYINDTLSICEIILPTSVSTFQVAVGKWNMISGEITFMEYTNPEIKRKRVALAVSPEHYIYVECYRHNDLMTICTLDGHLKYNIYGPHWNNANSNRMLYFGDVQFCKDKIVAVYANKANFSDDSLATQLLVFDLTGNYIKTLDVGYRIIHTCYDADNDRLLFAFDDEIQFGYLPMEGLL
jgi:hypothetical protein